jgi:hypothetical protein
MFFAAAAASLTPLPGYRGEVPDTPCCPEPDHAVPEAKVWLYSSAQFKIPHSLGPFSKTCDQAGQPKIGEGTVTIVESSSTHRIMRSAYKISLWNIEGRTPVDRAW